MGVKRIFLVLFLVCLFSLSIVSAASLYGKIYDIELETLENVLVEINTTPKQRMVAKNGTYSFSVPRGDYKLTAKFNNTYSTLYVSEELSIVSDGAFVYDIFLFPDLRDEEELTNSLGDYGAVGIEEAVIVNGFLEGNEWYVLLVIMGVIFILVILYIFLGFSNRKIDGEIADLRKLVKKTRWLVKKGHIDEIKESTNNGFDLGQELLGGDLRKVIAIIKNNNGRTTQKEIRKEIPLSEAKISLMITELEDKGIVRKIKKGRGNVIVLNK